jgi:hypothetical protein
MALLKVSGVNGSLISGHGKLTIEDRKIDL